MQHKIKWHVISQNHGLQSWLRFSYDLLFTSSKSMENKKGRSDWEKLTIQIYIFHPSVVNNPNIPCLLKFGDYSRCWISYKIYKKVAVLFPRSILDCMESFSKGVHRALVPLESQAENVIAAELVEASPGYRMLTQMDVLAFLGEHVNEPKGVTSRSVHELGAVNENVFAVPKHTKVIDVIKSLRATSLSAVPIVEAVEPNGDAQILQVSLHSDCTFYFSISISSLLFVYYPC